MHDSHNNSGKSLGLSEDGYEVCVICHHVTQISTDMDIEARKFYISGAGQLCPRCAADIAQETECFI
ncbi:MAG: hypothetical protein ACLSVG_08645 [Clostridia bacterium]